MVTLASNTASRSNVIHWLEQSELAAVLRQEQGAAWQDAWGRLESQSTSASASMIDYQHAYMRSAGLCIVDMSLVLLNDGKPCAIWPLTLTLDDISGKLSSLGAPVRPPAFVTNLSPRTVKKMTASALRFVLAIQKAISQETVHTEEPITPNAITGLSEWHQQWMSIGASVAVKHDLYVDLRLSLDEIRANFRKSYRSLISSGQKKWTVDAMDNTCSNIDVWAEFKSLHRQVAGRVTRNDETWALQFQMIVQGEAILITLRDPASQNRMIGAGFFQLTRDEGLYSVAVYDRELFDQPIGHVVHQRAIELMKQRGLRWYRIGERCFPSDCPKPSDKEIDISFFKQGFASNLSPRFVFSVPCSATAFNAPDIGLGERGSLN
ncbi:FemAB family protein [Glaciimonas sp. GNP009]